MKFFIASDFEIGRQYTQEEFADLANAKLEREGKVVCTYWNSPGLPDDDSEWTVKEKVGESHYKALLINIEPIEMCTHPSEKIHHLCQSDQDEYITIKFECECGARVRPKSFEVCE